MGKDSFILREARWEDWQLLLQWRNDDETRMQSHNTEAVRVEDHKKWFKKVLLDPNKQVYIGYSGSMPIGTVRYEFAENEYILSWAIAPEARGRGFGKKLVSRLIEHLHDYPVKAEVKIDNIPSIRIAEFAGLTCVEEQEGLLIYSNNKGD